MALYHRTTIRWTDENLTRLYACSLHPRDYDLPPDHLAPKPAAAPQDTGAGYLPKDPSPPGGLLISPSPEDQPKIVSSTSGDCAQRTASPLPWARLPWQQEIFRAYLRVSRGLPPTGPLYADEEEITNARITAWTAANAADSTHAKTIDELCAWLTDPDESPPPPHTVFPEPRREQVANLVIVPSPDTGDAVARVGPDLAQALTNRREAYATPLTEFLYDFSRLRHFNHPEAIEYHMEWEHAMLQMRRQAADLEWRGYGGDIAARNHACICHLLLNTFQVIDMDICGLQFSGTIMQWEVPPTTSTFPVSVWFLVRLTGALFRLTMTEPFRLGELPIARALDGTMAFQYVEQGPNIFDLLRFPPPRGTRL